LGGGARPQSPGPLPHAPIATRRDSERTRASASRAGERRRRTRRDRDHQVVHELRLEKAGENPRPPSTKGGTRASESPSRASRSTQPFSSGAGAEPERPGIAARLGRGGRFGRREPHSLPFSSRCVARNAEPAVHDDRPGSSPLARRTLSRGLSARTVPIPTSMRRGRPELVGELQEVGELSLAGYPPQQCSRRGSGRTRGSRTPARRDARPASSRRTCSSERIELTTRSVISSVRR
jgi:hypothetical protein